MGRIYDATWGRVFSAIYDPMLRGAEEAGLRDRRREVLARASGAVIDVGAGTGANLGLYPEGLERLVLTEPDPHMARRLRAKLDESGPGAPEVMETPAENLPFEDDSFDTVVFTLVLCTVEVPSAALAEAARVLRPGGRLLFLEHVRGDGNLARWQDRLEVPWRYFADGCHCNRDTAAAIDASQFELETVERGRMPKSLPITEPLAWGSAKLST